eukprot:2710519-Rhodomonas_salina.2
MGQDSNFKLEYDKVLSAVAESLRSSSGNLGYREPLAAHRTFSFHLALCQWFIRIGIVPTFVTGRGLGVLVSAVMASRLSVRAAAHALSAWEDLSRVQLHHLQDLDGPGPGTSAPSWLDWTSGQEAIGKEPGSEDGEEGTVLANLSARLRNDTLLLSLALSPRATGLSLSTSASSSLAAESLFEAVALLYVRGHDINWGRLHSDCRHCKAEIPTYSFDPQRLWPVTSPPHVKTGADVSDVGILALEYYAPSHCMAAADIEELQGQRGRYTTGRGQNHVTFCSDDEDAVCPLPLSPQSPALA